MVNSRTQQNLKNQRTHLSSFRLKVVHLVSRESYKYVVSPQIEIPLLLHNT